MPVIFWIVWMDKWLDTGAQLRDQAVFYDKVTDQVQIIIWFGAIGYAAYLQSDDILPAFLAFAGVAFYSLRGYTKYVIVYLQMSEDKGYLEKSFQEIFAIEKN